MKSCRILPENPDQECLHQNGPGLLWGMCVFCGQPIPDHQITNKRTKTIDEKQTRLSLVLDLDHTLLHTTYLSELTKSEKEFLTPLVVDSQTLLEQEKPVGDLFSLDNGGEMLMTKLRPFVRTFLEEASQLFDLYVFTMGEWSYATDMVYLLDPKTRYFNRVRVYTRDDATLNNDKCLDVVSVAKSACLIIDDLEVVWPHDKDNLIQIRRYNYFASSYSDHPSLSQLKADELETTGSLARILQVRRRVHAAYLEGGGSDGREILKDIRRSILGGCKVVFSSCLRDEGSNDMDEEIKKLAVELGAIWEANLGPTVTHVVAGDPTSEAAVWAAKEGKFLVSCRWIQEAYCQWQRPNEGMYRVTQ